MAITEPNAGSDSAAIRTTARLDGDHYVLNGEKIFVTAGERCDVVVVWATLDPRLGRAAIKSFVVEKGTPGMEVRAARAQAGHPRIGHRDHPVRRLPHPQGEPARQRRDRPQEELRGRDADVRQHASDRGGMSLGVARAALERTRELLEKEGVRVDYGGPLFTKSAVEAELISWRRSSKRRAC